MGQVICLDEFYQENLIVKKFLFKSDVNSLAQRRYKFIVLLDRDGTIIKEREYISDPKELEFEHGAVTALKKLQLLGAFVAVVSNQAGLAKGEITFDEFSSVNSHFLHSLIEQGTNVQATIYCPFHENGIIPEYTCNSDFRKPATGMYRLLQQELKMDAGTLFVVGDKLSDIEFGNRLGANTFFVTTGHGKKELPNLQKSRLSFQIRRNLSDAVNEIVKNSQPTSL